MKSILYVFTSLLFVACAITHAQEAYDDYRLGPGDGIDIRVFGEPDLSMSVLIGDSGRLNYPLLGEVQVGGLTVSEIEQRLTNGLRGDYLIDPAVTVAVSEYRPFYVNGEVENPGAYAYQPGLTLQKAIALAGGFTERAARSNISIATANQTTVEKAQLGAAIKPGDVITVDESFF